MTVRDILRSGHYTPETIAQLLAATDPAEIETVRDAAERVLLDTCGNRVFFRGLIEFSNVCDNDCFYCGIYKANSSVRRYTLTQAQIIEAATWCAGQGYGSVVLQSGERRDEEFVGFVETAVREIKRRTVSNRLPHGLGITLCIGEQTDETYSRLFAAGAHRYLLRIETTSPRLFEAIHPPTQLLTSRIACLISLKRIGYQVGTGVMIGLPGQTVEELANDVLFFRDMDIDMIGMGPYIPHNDTPMAGWPAAVQIDKKDSLRQALLMIAAVRLVLRDVNIAATTALQAIDPVGRESGLQFGANVIMPQLTPQQYRHAYQLYEGKPCMDESADLCRNCLENRIRSVGRDIAIDDWGDSPHWRKNQSIVNLSP
jgi:biotin synthase